MSTPSKSPKAKDRGKGLKCVFCEQGNVCEETYGKLLSKAGVTAHYFCMLFSSGLSQNGKTEKQGILGFLQSDIMKEVKRGSRLRCSYCRKIGATIGCVIRNCKKMFHLGCGRSNSTLHQFFGTFSSFCPAHRQQQDVPSDDDPNIVCSICMNTVTAAPSNDTIRAPCCRKYWYHRECVQRYATSAGLYFFKCPLCNNKDEFQDEMLTMGIYIPDQDASWEKEPHAFQELLERYGNCDAPVCKCVEGRKYDKEGSKWEIILCDFCGSHGAHVACNHLEKLGKHDICSGCKEVDERTREEEYLLRSPPHKRKSLDLLQLELASSPEASKGTSPYPGPSNSMRKLGLPNSQTGKAKKDLGSRKGKRTPVLDNGDSPPILKRQKRSGKASATVTSVSAKRGRTDTILSPSTSSQSSDDSSDDDLPFSSLKLKLQKIKLENAWDVKRRKKMESQRKCAEKREKRNNTVDSDLEIKRKRKVNSERNRNMVVIDSESDTSAESIVIKEKSEEIEAEKGRKSNVVNEKKVLCSDSGRNTDAHRMKGSIMLQEQKRDMSDKRLSLVETNLGTGKDKADHHRSSFGALPSTAASGSSVKKKQGKLKKKSVENDKSQTTLTDWLKPKSKETKSKEKLELLVSPEPAEKDEKRGNKKPVTIEWKGKQLIIKSPRVVLKRSRNRKVGKMKPKCLEIDMNDRKGSLDWNKDIDLLSNLETDVRVTRKMIDIDQVETRISAKTEKPLDTVMSPARGALEEENTKTTAVTELSDTEHSDGNLLSAFRSSEIIDADKNLDSDVTEKAKTSSSNNQDSPAKNLRVRNTKEDAAAVKSANTVQSVCVSGMEHSKQIPIKTSPLKNTNNSKSILHQSEKPACEIDSPAKNLRLRLKKDPNKTKVLESVNANYQESLEKENQHTPTMQNKNVFNFTVIKEKNSTGEALSVEKGSPLIHVKESAEWGSVILINDTNEDKESETVVNNKANNDNIERLKMYQPVLPETCKLEDSPAKNLRKRNHQLSKMSEEMCTEMDKVKNRKNELNRAIDKSKEPKTSGVDSDSDSSAKSNHLERLKKYKPKVYYLNTAEKSVDSVEIVPNMVKRAVKTAPNSPRFIRKQDNFNNQQNVVWHLEGTRQLDSGAYGAVYSAGCENTCPNPQPASKGVKSVQLEETRQNASKGGTGIKGFYVSDILGKNLGDSKDKVPTTVNEIFTSNDLCNTANNLSSAYFTKSLESFSTKVSGTDSSAVMKCTTPPPSHGNQAASFPLAPKNILNGIKPISASNLRSSPRSAKKSSTSVPIHGHMSDKMSMAEYYGANLRANQKEKVNDVSLEAVDDDDDDIVELPLLIGASTIM